MLKRKMEAKNQPPVARPYEQEIAGNYCQLDRHPGCKADRGGSEHFKDGDSHQGNRSERLSRPCPELLEGQEWD